MLIYMEPRPVYDPAIVGYVYEGGKGYVVYDRDMVVEALISSILGEMSREEAEEFHLYNQAGMGAWYFCEGLEVFYLLEEGSDGPEGPEGDGP